MYTVGDEIRSQNLLRIKKIIDEDNNGDRFIIVRTKKNLDFIREYGLTNNDIKNIIRQLSVEDCYAGPEADRDSQYEGSVFKFRPLFENIKLYVKIRIENRDKAICLSVHEFGKYDGVE